MNNDAEIIYPRISFCIPRLPSHSCTNLCCLSGEKATFCAHSFGKMNTFTNSQILFSNFNGLWIRKWVLTWNSPKPLLPFALFITFEVSFALSLSTRQTPAEKWDHTSSEANKKHGMRQHVNSFVSHLCMQRYIEWVISGKQYFTLADECARESVVT